MKPYELKERKPLPPVTPHQLAWALRRIEALEAKVAKLEATEKANYNASR